MIRRSIVLALLLPLADPAPGDAQAPVPRADVPVRTVVLYSSGVGYFEHAGTVRGTGTTELRFRTAQINDVLKSLVLQDQDGGRVSTIRYPSRDPLSRTLRSFQVDITGNPGLADLLNQLRGASVTVQWQAERLAGTVLGVETRLRSVDGGEPVAVPVLNLLAGATIRSVELPAITSLSLDDPLLQAELTRALGAVSQARDQDTRPVTIAFDGTGERRVRIGYVVEAPVWKTSYRLLLDGDSARLQGWAIIENQTDSDWTDVSLSLVSGRPISFVMDLYQPLYATRPTVVPELFAGLRPRVYEGATAEERERVEMDAALANRRRAGALRSDSIAAAARPPLALAEAAALYGQVVGGAGGGSLASTVQSIAAAARMGALFRYTVGGVTLPRQESAMLPIIADGIGVERVSIYNAAVLRRHPLNGARLTNTTGKHLLQGPITVVERDGYAGDARIDDVPPGQERLISHGIDLEMLIDDTKNTQASTVVTGRIVKGMLLLDRRHVATVEYRADNTGERARTLIVEHPIRQGWTLSETRRPAETTPTLYRFEGAAPPGRVTTLTVTESMVATETMAVLSADLGQLLSHARTGAIPPAVRDGLTEAVRRRQALIDAEREIARRTQRITEITEEQTRIRENMKTVAQSTQYYERLLAKLDEQESALEALRAERDALAATRDARRSELEAYVTGLTIG